MPIGSPDLDLHGPAYSPPAGDAVHLDLAPGAAVNAARLAGAVGLAADLAVRAVQTPAVVDATVAPHAAVLAGRPAGAVVIAAAIAPVAQLTVRRCEAAQLAAAIAVQAAVQAAWNANTFRGPSPAVAQPWAEGVPARPARRGAWRGARRSSPDRVMVWGAAAPRCARLRATQGHGLPADAFRRQPWQRADTAHARPAAARYPWHFGLPRQRPWRGLYGLAGPRAAAPWAAPWHHGAAVNRRPWGAPWRHAAPALVLRQAPWGAAEAYRGWWRLPWGIGRPVLSFGSPLPPYIPPPPPPPGGQVQLVLRCPLPDAPASAMPLVFSFEPCPGAGTGGNAIPVRRVYFVSNSISMVRLPGREPIEATRIALAIDAEAWAWNLQAQIAAADLPLVQPSLAGPAEIEVQINGVTWICVVEEIAEDRRFGAAGATIAGRSLSAYLAAPYAPLRSRDEASAKTAQQLAEDELNTPAPSGWLLDWTIDDWLVDGGLFSYAGRAPIDAIAAIAGAAGAYLQPHTEEMLLRVLARYPLPPWEWAGAEWDAQIPPAAVERLALRYQQYPEINAVYVSGERAGITALVKRAGSAGDLLAPSVTDALITAAAAARGRGTSILARSGRAAMVTIDLPLLAPVGLIAPGQFVRYAEAVPWIGLARGVTVQAQRTQQALTVRQSVEIERHYG